MLDVTTNIITYHFVTVTCDHEKCQYSLGFEFSDCDLEAAKNSAMVLSAHSANGFAHVEDKSYCFLHPEGIDKDSMILLGKGELSPSLNRYFI